MIYLKREVEARAQGTYIWWWFRLLLAWNHCTSPTGHPLSSSFYSPSPPLRLSWLLITITEPVVKRWRDDQGIFCDLCSPNIKYGAQGAPPAPASFPPFVQILPRCFHLADLLERRNAKSTGLMRVMQVISGCSLHILAKEGRSHTQAQSLV